MRETSDGSPVQRIGAVDSRAPGTATPTGTARASDRLGGSRRLGKTELVVAPIGYSSAHAHGDSPVHRRSLASALRAGVNLVELALAAREFPLEPLLGVVLRNLVSLGEVRRDEIVLIGRLDEATVVEGERDVVDVVDRACDRVGIDTIDVVLLEVTGAAIDPSEHRDALLRAFAALEVLVRRGLATWYGIAVTSPVSHDDWARFDLSGVLALAREVGGVDHRFGVLQLPINVLELGAVARPRGKDATASPTVLELARAEDLGVLGDRTLPIASRTRTFVRPRFEDALVALTTLRKLEARWATGLGQRLVTQAGDNAADLFRWGQELTRMLPAMEGLAGWQAIRHDVIAPHLGQTSAALLQHLTGAARADFAQFWVEYGGALHAVFTAIEAAFRVEENSAPLERDANSSAGRLGDVLDPWLPDSWRGLSLRGKAILTVLSAPVSAVWVDLPEPGDVHEILALRENPVGFPAGSDGRVDLAGLAAAVASFEL